MLYAEVEKAEAEKTEAEGKAAARLLIAEAEAKANKLLEESMTPAVLQYQSIKIWDGKLPTFMGGTTPVPFIDVKSLASTKAAE